MRSPEPWLSLCLVRSHAPLASGRLEAKRTLVAARVSHALVERCRATAQASGTRGGFQLLSGSVIPISLAPRSVVWLPLVPLQLGRGSGTSAVLHLPFVSLSAAECVVRSFRDHRQVSGHSYPRDLTRRCSRRCPASYLDPDSFMIVIRLSHTRSRQRG